MKIHTKKEMTFGKITFFPSYNIDFIYSTNTYSGYLEGKPSIENGHNERATEELIKTSKKLYTHLNPFIYTGNLDKSQVFPYRGNIAFFHNMERHMIVIWFDDGILDNIKSLEEIFDNLDFEKNSEEFCW